MLTRATQWLLIGIFLQSTAAAQEISPADASSGSPISRAVQSDETADKTPKPELERPTTWGEPTEVEVSILVLDVDEVNSAEQSFAASVYYQARWRSPFLVHEGPGPLHLGLTEVWSPRLTILNQQQAWNAYPGSVEISPNGEILYRQKVWGRFSQPLDLRDFPFDSQTLTVHIVAADLLESDVKMVPLDRGHGNESGIGPQFSLPDFEVLSSQAGAMPYVPVEGAPGTAGFAIQIEVHRYISYYFWKIIVPLCLIVIMSWLPRWTDPEQMGINIGVSTTAFLTLVAYLFAINSLLPRVPYLTRIDRFILLSTLMVFGSMLQTVASTVLINRKKKALDEQVNRWSRVVYPAILVLVLFISFVV